MSNHGVAFGQSGTPRPCWTARTFAAARARGGGRRRSRWREIVTADPCSKGSSTSSVVMGALRATRGTNERSASAQEQERRRAAPGTKTAAQGQALVDSRDASEVMFAFDGEHQADHRFDLAAKRAKSFANTEMTDGVVDSWDIIAARRAGERRSIPRRVRAAARRGADAIVRIWEALDQATPIP